MTSSPDGKGLGERRDRFPIPKLLSFLRRADRHRGDEKPYHTMGLDATDLYAAASFAGPDARPCIPRPCLTSLLLEHDLFRKAVPTPDQVRGRLVRDRARRRGWPHQRRKAVPA